jgi:hypothetical protein
VPEEESDLVECSRLCESFVAADKVKAWARGKVVPRSTSTFIGVLAALLEKLIVTHTSYL